jgi:hypothetical protein
MFVFILAFDRVIAWRIRRKFKPATTTGITTSTGKSVPVENRTAHTA